MWVGWEWSCKGCVQGDMQPLPQGLGRLGVPWVPYQKRRVTGQGAGHSTEQGVKVWEERCGWGVRKKREAIGVGGGGTQ